MTQTYIKGESTSKNAKVLDAPAQKAVSKKTPAHSRAVDRYVALGFQEKEAKKLLT